MKKKWFALTLKLAVSGGLIWYLIYNIDLGAVKLRLAEVEPLMLIAGGGVLLFQMIIAGFRWSVVLRGIGITMRFWEVVHLFYIGSFFSQALPGGAGGDVVRVYLVYKGDWGLRGAINGVVLERVATVLALVLLVIGTLPFFYDALDPGGQAWVLPAVIFMCGGTAIGLCVLFLLDKLPIAFNRWRVVQGLGELAHDARSVFLDTGIVLPALFWSALGHINMAIVVYVLAFGLNLEIGIFDCIVLMPPVLLVMTIPISIGAWGVRENAMVVAFGLIGVNPEAATVLGLLLGVVTLVVAIPGGLLWLLGRKRGGASLADVQAELAAVEPRR